jgi:6-phosphogluconolactonase (cycloisomerase 2 family)
VYVLNESATAPFTEPSGPGAFVDATGNISGFTVGSDGTLTPIAGSTQKAGAGGREISFDPTGSVLVVTNRTDNNIDTYIVGPGGVAETPTITASADPDAFGPFGFAFDSAGNMIVADSNTAPSFNPSLPSGASSYSVSDTGTVLALSTFVANGQNITCWVVVVGKYAYTTNAIGSTTVAQLPNVTPGTISSYRIGSDGTLTLVNGAAGTLPGTPGLPGHFAVDEAASPDGKFLYVLDISLPPDAPDQAQIDTFAINGDGTLTYVGSSASLPGGPGFSGIAAG